MVTSDDHFHHASIQFKPTMAEIATTYSGAITFRKKMAERPCGLDG
jgi:hypothetical protein